MDSKGLITKSRGDKLAPHKESLARTDDTPNIKDLKEIVAHVKPHALIGMINGRLSTLQGPYQRNC